LSERRKRIAAVFGAALLARLLFLFAGDQPLLYTHQYTYFTNALRIAEHEQPLRYLVASDEWRTWDQHWTIAPLYFVLAAAVFDVFGAHLLPLQLLQCLLDALVAACVAALGERVAGRHGAWAGLAYALYWPAIELTSWTMTENAHTPLFVTALLALVREREQPSARRRFLAGLLLGFSALARAVSSAFVGLAALWRAWPWPLRRGDVRAGSLVLAGGLLAILPWTARNVFVMGEKVLIEDAAFENIWWANNLEDRETYLKQEKVVHSQPTSDAKRSAALGFAIAGVRNHPERVPDKIATAFWHFLRPEGLQNLLRIERSLEPWRHVVTLLLDDLPMLLCVPPFAVFLIAARRSPTRGLIALWTAYYLFMVVIVFHNEVRYRSALMPLAFVGAAGGVATLLDAELRRRVRTLLAALLGLALVAGMLRPYVGPAYRALIAASRLRPLQQAVERSDRSEADRIAARAAEADLRSARPWNTYGRLLAWRGEGERALLAYRRAAEVASIANWAPRIALPRLLAETGDPREAAQTLRQLDRLSWNTDPWLMLELAWRELPPPNSDEILLARGDYGAVRGFLHPRGTDPGLSAPRLEWNKYERIGTELPPPGGHRWSRHRAWLRLVPATPAIAYDVTLEMGAPFPSTLRAPQVRVRVNDGPATVFTLTNEIRPYALRAPAPPAGSPLLVELDTPTWCIAGEPAEQGVRVDRMSVRVP